MSWTTLQNAGQEQFARTLYVPPRTAALHCPSCGGEGVRVIWKAVRDKPQASMASYSCEQCRHFWLGQVLD